MSTEQLSDYNVSGQRSSIVSRRRQYSDLDLSLTIHPGKGDITPLMDIAAVKNSIRNLILTGKYERPFQPDISAGIKSLLFENATPDTRYMLEYNIKEVISQYEPRVDDVKVEVQDDSDNNAYYVTVIFNVRSMNIESSMSIYLERIR